MEGKRSEKVADLIRKEISQMLVKSIKDPRIGFVTITRVTVSEDCRFAKIYFSVAGTLEERENSRRVWIVRKAISAKNWGDGSD